MPLDEPSWWYRAPQDWRARLLGPVARVYAWQAGRRLHREPGYRSTLPVVCIGNFTAGGTGKTPLVAATVAHLANRGLRAAVLTRGYGGRSGGPRWVDASIDRAEAVGDEPLLLAGHAPVLVSRDRAAGARLIEAVTPALDVIVMDDGLQSPALAKDLTIAVIDGRRGLGNGRVMPAGPLRADLAGQLSRVDVIVVNMPPGMEAGQSDVANAMRRHFDGPVLTASPATTGEFSAPEGAPVVAFAGIANPSRFFDLLRASGANVVETIAFPDHRAFTEADAERLLATMRKAAAKLVTTEKDWVRLIGHTGARGQLRDSVGILRIRLAFEARDAERFAALLDGLMAGERRTAAD